MRFISSGKRVTKFVNLIDVESSNSDGIFSAIKKALDLLTVDVIVKMPETVQTNVPKSQGNHARRISASQSSLIVSL